MITSAKDHLDLASVRNLFCTQVKSVCVLGTIDHILVIHANQLIILFIIYIFSPLFSAILNKNFMFCKRRIDTRVLEGESVRLKYQIYLTA